MLMVVLTYFAMPLDHSMDVRNTKLEFIDIWLMIGHIHALVCMA